MKKIVYSLFLILTGVATLVSCQKDEADFSLSAVIADKPEVVSNPNAKAYIEEVNSVYYARWHNGDIVNINNQPCTLSVSSTSAAAVINNITLSGSGYTAVYPYGAGALDGTTATVTIPATQSYRTAQADGTATKYQVVDGPMVAYCASGDNVLRFHNAAGIIRVRVNNTTAETLKVHYVSVESSDGSYLAGSGTVNAASETPKLAEIASNGSKSVTLDCCDDATDKHPEIAPSGSMDFYLAVAPFSGKQLKIKVMTEKVEDDGKYKYIFSSTTTQAGGLSLDRNEIGKVTMSLEDANRQELLFYGAGTKDCPFLISSYDDLDQLRTIVNSGNATAQSTYNTNQIHYLQTATNIATNSSWGSNTAGTNWGIGYCTDYPFRANYNGGDNTITLSSALESNTTASLNYGYGLFGICSGGGSITNLNTTGSLTASNKNTTRYGGIVGQIRGDFSIKHCSSNVYMNVTGAAAQNSTYAGGICGYIDASGAKIDFIDCEYTNTIYSTADYGCCMGGICAYVFDASKVYFNNCRNTEHTLTIKFGTFGGICGRVKSNVEFISCENNWNIDQGTNTLSNIGGIVGYCDNSAVIDGCTNNGFIKGYTYIGGLIGYAYGSLVIKGTSQNTGAITSSYTSSYSCYTGGVVGSANSTVSISGDITNSGPVKGAKKTGGIIGYSNGKITIDANVTNDTLITANGNFTEIGGIIGYANSGCDVNIDCSDGSKKVTNNGRVISTGSNNGATGSTQGVGGIIGSAIKSVNVRNCYNTNTVSNKGGVGGIIGLVSLSENSTVYDCLNTGYIYGQEASGYGVGGIVGDVRCSNSEKGITIMNCGCENKNIVGNKGYAGGIVGLAYSNGNNIVKIYNCYCNTNVSGKNVGGILTAYKGSYTNSIYIRNCYYNGTLSGTSYNGSISYNYNAQTVFDFSHCYSDNTTTPTVNPSEGDYTGSGSTKAARTFTASDGLYAAIGANVTDANWVSGKTLVSALNSQVTSGNSYRTWVTPAGKVLPTLGL